MDFYKNWEAAFRACNQEDREKSKAHWLKCHAENLASGRLDMIIFSAQILAHIENVENEGIIKWRIPFPICQPIK